MLLTTERLIIRPIIPEDIDGIMRYVCNPNVAHFLPFQSTQTREKTIEIMKGWQTEMDNGTDMYFAVLPNEAFTAELIMSGKISPDNSSWTLGCFSIIFKDKTSLNFGWCLSEEFWGMGIMPEVLNATIAYYKTERNIKYVETLYNAKNKKSGIAMEKCGFIKTGEVIKPSTEDGHYGEDAAFVIMSKSL